MENFIFIKDVLVQMKLLSDGKKPIAFSVKVRSFNLQNKAAGKVIYYPHCELMQKPKKNKHIKNPNHWENRTRNIKLPDGSIKKIHTIFIIEFNGKKVVY